MSPENIFDPDPVAPGGVTTPDFFLPRPQRGHDLGNVFRPQTGVTIPAGSLRGRPREDVAKLEFIFLSEKN